MVNANALLDPFLRPLLLLNPFLSILIIAFIITVIITLAYKFITDQTLMKELRNELKDLQKEIKKLKDNPDKAMEVQSEMMQTNMKYMMQSLKPTMFTFIPIILIFGWLNAHMAFYQIMPEQSIEVTALFDDDASGTVELVAPEGISVLTSADKQIEAGKADWKIKGKEGDYTLQFMYGDITYNKTLLITSERRYAPVEKKYKEGKLQKVVLGNERVHPLDGVLGKKFEIFGWRPGWLGVYIIFSIIFSTVLRRLLKIA